MDTNLDKCLISISVSISTEKYGHEHGYTNVHPVSDTVSAL